MCTVSIIVPVYNGEAKVERCANSILNQDFKDIELILIDDGSKDNSWNIMQEIAKKDERVKIYHKENGGVSSTRNKGIELAEGKYIQFVDVDDYLPLDSTKQLVRSMTDDVGMVIADFYRVVGENVSVQGSIDNDGIISIEQYADEMLKTPADFYYGVLWNKLFRKDIIDQYDLHLDESISYCEDVIFNLAYLEHIQNVYVLKVPVYYYIKTKGSLVEQNADIEHTVKMKTTVITYYSDFYKKIYSPEEYNRKKLLIYSYLVAISTDGISLPFLSMKIGEESGQRFFDNNNLENTIISSNYLSEMLLNRYLNTLAQKYLLDQNEIRILYFLWLSNKPCSSEEIAAFTGLPTLTVTSSLIIMNRKKYLQKVEKDQYVFTAQQFEQDFQQVTSDFYNTCYEGLSLEEIEQYESLRNRIDSNINKILNTVR